MVLNAQGTTYTYQTLTVGDPANPIGICTLWTPQEKVARVLQPSEYGRIGNLYSRDGINHIIRNVLADPVVRYIVVCGVDLTGSGEAFLKFAQNGIDEEYRIIGDVGLIDRALPRDAIEDFRRSVQLIDRRGPLDPERLRETLRALPYLPPFAPPRVFPITEPQADVFPAEGPGMVARGRRVADVWVEALRLVMQFGVIHDGPFGGRQKDLADLLLVVSDERPEAPHLPPWLPVTPNYLEEIAYPLLLSPTPPPELADTEGQRLFDYGGRDQIASLIATLRDHPGTHAATAALWDPHRDPARPTAPNLMLIQARRRAGALLLTAYLRSVDLYRSWPETAFTLRRLQRLIADSVGQLKLGSLSTLIHAAYIADDAWDLARDVIEQRQRRTPRRPRQEERDPRGSFVIRVEDGAIVVVHYSPQGVRLQEFRGTSAAELALQIKPYFSQIDHALHIGGELAKAEIALRTPGAVYLQDHPLRLPEPVRR
ncbi:MAG: thymidylate synthase [Chloroflexota bacterium]|nr:thymidylate synthase [Dehalococcoidia bacterium]MDW8254434.1 thymidylate synthase [Chloroflexota bacterium]